MNYNPQIHHRRSIRLKGYDYSQAGAYFITICTHNKKCRFGKIENGEMKLNEYGTIAYNEWIALTDRFVNFEIDVFQIMPNHMHAIIVLNNTVGAGLAPAPKPSEQMSPAPKPSEQIFPDKNISDAKSTGAKHRATIGDIVGVYKSLVSNGCLDVYKLKWAGVNPASTMGKIWQRNYYEHIIRNELSYKTISEYIINNPSKWNSDKFYMG